VKKKGTRGGEGKQVNFFIRKKRKGLIRKPSCGPASSRGSGPLYLEIGGVAGPRRRPRETGGHPKVVGP